MARPLRLEHEYAVWHVTARGNEQRDIYRDDADRERFLLKLSQTVVRFGWRLISWTLMSNHYHLVVQTPQPNLSRGMHWLNARYAQSFNRRHGRRGHLFQGRFHGVLVEKESYLLAVARYVVLNPVRAGMVANPADYRWSSYRQTAGLDAPEPWLAVGDLLESFGGANRQGCEEYVRFVTGGTGQMSPWKDLVGQIYLGSTEWLDRIGARIASAPRSAEHPRVQLEPGRPMLNDIIEAVAKTFDATVEQVQSRSRQVSMARSVVAFIGFEDGLYRQSEIAAVLRIGGRSSVSAMIRRCRNAVATNDQFAQLIVTCRSQLPRVPMPVPLPLPERIGFYDERPWFRPNAPRR
jgi:REP element-mobilizing transposase RayT